MSIGFGRSRLVALACAVVGAFTLNGAAPAGAAVQPFGTNDAGGFRNVLPPGEAGVDNTFDLATFMASGTAPNHFFDQQPLYDGLIKGAPGLTNAGIANFYKDATFGVPEGGVERTETPRPGVTIQRDSAYGIPHIYGDTRADTMFGAGYVNAEDRLFLMDILRHTGRADLSSFIGGSAGNRAMDRNQWQFAPYTEADLQSQIDQAPALYGAEGTALIDDANNYVAGINKYISEAQSDPTKLPSEYSALLKSPQPWKLTDVVATASLIGGIFGKGGGREVDSAQTLQALVKRFGGKPGRKAFMDFRSKNDPEAPTTVLGKRFPYETQNAFSKRGLAIPDPGSVTATPSAPPPSRAAQPAETSEFGNIGADLLRVAKHDFHASNWEMVSARESKTGHPIGVLGPQVGYYLPQILMEVDLHGPGVDARGATFPGVGLYVLLGHGRDYAWSATTGTADNVDTFAEVLCGGDEYHYLYKGQCMPMERLDRNNSWTPSAVDMTPPGSETLTVYRTVHGIVSARGTVKGKKVAFVTARSTYFHEADSALFFSRMNNPDRMRNPKTFREAIKVMNFGFNWGYIDSKHIAYYLAGAYPRRAKGVSPDFPVFGTGPYDWRNYNPATHTQAELSVDEHPHAVDQSYLVSWNNKQAPGWAAADDQYAYGSVHRSEMIADKVARGVKGPRKMRLSQLVQAMEFPATQDLRALKVVPLALKMMGKPKGAALKSAVATLNRWMKAGSHRRDLDSDGTYEFDDAITLMDAWWPNLVEAEFGPSLGPDGMKAVSGMLSVGDHTRGNPNAPDFFSGWWGYASKDLRTILGREVKGRYSRIYCGKGSKVACAKALRKSLLDSLTVTKKELYGKGDCAGDADAQCYDQNRSIVASAIGIDPMPFQNRPTFQQTVSISHSLPR